MTALRRELPPLPDRITTLPVDSRGYPVPWFVEWLDGDGRSGPRGQGTPDFRIMSRDALGLALRSKLCWVCGKSLGSYKTFVVGPMCAVNRTSAEPPSHLDCADWSAAACPFLSRPHMRRRDAGLPEGGTVDAPGIALKRNPGVTLVWTTRRYATFRDPNGGLLFDIGDPEHVRWYAEGRRATRAEIVASIDSGLPTLREVVDQHHEGRELDRCVERAMELVPA